MRSLSLSPAARSRDARALEQVAPGLVQPGFEHCPGWGIHSLPGHPVQCLNAADVTEASRKHQHRQSWFLKNEFSRLCHPKTHHNRKLQNLHCWTELLVLRFRGKALQCVGSRQVCTCVLVPAPSHCSDSGGYCRAQGLSRTAFGTRFCCVCRCCAESRCGDCAGHVESAVRWARSEGNKIKCHQCENVVPCLFAVWCSWCHPSSPSTAQPAQGCPTCRAVCPAAGLSVLPAGQSVLPAGLSVLPAGLSVLPAGLSVLLQGCLSYLQGCLSCCRAVCPTCRAVCPTCRAVCPAAGLSVLLQGCLSYLQGCLSYLQGCLSCCRAVCPAAGLSVLPAGLSVLLQGCLSYLQGCLSCCRAVLQGCPACSGAVQLSLWFLFRTPQCCTWSIRSLHSH
ncbi:uncharacterized protein GJ701_002201 [Geothlypis trichas]